MAKSSFQDELERRATRAILVRSFYRWESAVILALTLVLTAFTGAGAIGFLPPFWQWWYWLLLGLSGEAALIWSSLKDPEFRAHAVGEMFREKFNTRGINDGELKAQVNKALEYRDRIDGAIARSREGVLRDHLQDVSGGITNWMENVFLLVRRLDAYQGDQTIHRDRQSVEPEIESLKKRLASEDDDSVKRQISQAIAQKQIQRDNLNKLQNVMEKAEFQLESTITAMGTVYSQMMILGSRDLSAGRAQRLQQDIDDQVRALQDVVHTLDEVYQQGTGPLGLGLGATLGVGANLATGGASGTDAKSRSVRRTSGGS
jgi:hypothetical protein